MARLNSQLTVMDVLSGNFGPNVGDFIPDPPTQNDRPPPTLRAAASIPPAAIEEGDDDVSTNQQSTHVI